MLLFLLQRPDSFDLQSPILHPLRFKIGHRGSACDLEPGLAPIPGAMALMVSSQGRYLLLHRRCWLVFLTKL